MATPLIKTLNIQGGTLYTFQSAAKDITQTFNNSGLKFKFSKFACIDLPDIKRPLVKDNNIQFDTIDGAILNASNLSDDNVALSEHFQNYALNLETLLLKQPLYNSNIKRTVSERVFFKWLKEVGGIRFRQANVNESQSTKYVEEDNSIGGTQNYESVVKYLGNLNVVNNVKKGGETYSEIYININTTHGGTPTILFDVTEDDNYKPNLVLTGQNEAIDGRSLTSVHPTGLSLSAFYDYDDSVTHTGQNELWMGTNPTPNSYFTEPLTFTDASNIEIVKNKANYGSSTGNVSYLRSKLDGVHIDFNELSYKQIIDDASIKTFSDFNQLKSTSDFSFNAVLIYYDLYSTQNPNDRATNLYGVLFLDNVEDNGANGAKIKPFKKYKFNPITQLNGNSYGLKLNIKFDSSIENSSVDTVINDYNAYSLNLFSDALTEMKLASKQLLDAKTKVLQYVSKIDSLESTILDIPKIEQINIQINELTNKFNNANLLVNDIQSFNDSFAKINNKIDDILTGKTPADISINFDLLVFGDGVKSSITQNGKMYIESTQQSYSNITYNALNYGFQNENLLSLKNYANIFIEKTPEVNVENDVFIFVKDDIQKWQTGQTYELSFPNTIVNTNGKSISIYTDVNNRFGSGSYSKLVGTIDSTKFKTNTKFQIICIDGNNYTFVIEQIK